MNQNFINQFIGKAYVGQKNTDKVPYSVYVQSYFSIFMQIEMHRS